MSTAEKPKYRLTEKAYMRIHINDPKNGFIGLEDTYLDPELMPFVDKDDETLGRKPLIVEYEGHPGHHMMPMNAAAEEMVKKFPPILRNPINDMTSVVSAASDAEIAKKAAEDAEAKEIERRIRVEIGIRQRVEQEMGGKKATQSGKTK